MLGLLLTLSQGGIALAAPDDAAEEIIVYGDHFARWDHTRWLVQTELWMPLGISFAADRNRSDISLETTLSRRSKSDRSDRSAPAAVRARLVVQPTSRADAWVADLVSGHGDTELRRSICEREPVERAERQAKLERGRSDSSRRVPSL